jgi:hypothetical protein
MQRRLLCLVVGVLFATVSPLNAAADLIFDFEDGTFQGWEPMNDVFLAPTTGVFGPGQSMTLFGIDNAWITMDVDLTNVDRLILDVFTPSKAILDANALYVTVRPSNSPPFDVFSDWDLLDGEDNPGGIAILLEGLTGIHEIRIAWNGIVGTLETDPSRPMTVNFPAYIDKITFTTFELPEPGALLLMLASIAPCVLHALVGARRRRLGLSSR